MDKVTINDNNLTESNINKKKNKARALLIDDDKILIANYNGVVLFPGGSIDKGETPNKAIIRELEEETGTLYRINDLSHLFVLEHYQPDYPAGDNETINRLITTYFYLAKFQGVNLDKVKRTENEKNNDFYLELIELRNLLTRIKEKSNNPRKQFFDREMEEVVKVFKKARGRYN